MFTSVFDNYGIIILHEMIESNKKEETMKIFSEDEIDAAAEVLNSDGVIAAATDTVYGVCCRMQSQQAQEKLRDIKHRPLDKAFPIMASDIKQVEEFAVIEATGRKIMTSLLPGPGTVILRKKEDLPEYINGGLPTVAVRLATSEQLKKLIEKTGPLFMTSANQSGQPVCQSIEEIEQSCPDLDGILYGQPSFGKASTIIDCTKEDVRILRQGPITEAQIQKALGK